MLPPKRSTRTTYRDGTAEPVIDAHSKVNDIQDQCFTNIYSSPLITGAQSRDKANQATSPSSNTQGDCTSSQKKARRKLSTPQRLALEELSTHGLNPSLGARRTVAEENGLYVYCVRKFILYRRLNVSFVFYSELKVVSVWFQNKRRPANSKCDESTIDFQNTEPRKADQRNRRVLANINGSVNSQAFVFSKSKSIADETLIGVSKHDSSLLSGSLPSKDSYAQAHPGLWDFLPSSSPGPSSEAYFSDDEPQREVISEVPVQKKKRQSLEWACEKDERTTKRARKSEEYGLQKRDRTSPTTFASVHARHQRQRTDRKPRRPSPRTLNRIVPVPKPRSHSHGSLGHHGSFSCCTEKEIMDVALALVQLKGQGEQVRQARKSI